MTRPLRRLAIYCGSASPENARYEELAMEIGHELAARGIGVVYGGGKLGLMGAVSAGALLAGGEVIGVIPEALVAAEVANKACTELHVVQTMHERKKAFTDLSDGFLTLPGGVGTMDELWEAISWAQLGYHASPVGILNAWGFYDGLLFHRVVPDFVIQGGDPRGDGFGGPGYDIRDEINPLRYRRGVAGMALAGPDTGGSQFFITLSEQPHLDGGYTSFGEVVAGDEVLDRIVPGDRIEGVVEVD